MDKKMILQNFFLYFCGGLTFTVGGFAINALQLIIFFTVKRFSLYWYQKINYYLAYTYFSLYIFFVDWYSKSELNVYMDANDFRDYFGKEHAFLICNHTYEIDWLMLLSLADKAHCAGNSKTFIKNSVQWTPGFGMVLYLADYICLARNFDKDKITIEKKIQEIVNYPDPIWLVLYPEGTRFTKQKHENSMKYAREKGLPELKNHLSPRTKGFTTSIVPMKDKMGALYDVTISFKPTDENRPKLTNLFLAKTVKAHIYIKRIPFDKIPLDETVASDFIHETYIQKDKLLESFRNTGDFFAESGVTPVDCFQMKRNWGILINAICWYVFSVGMVLTYLLRLLSAGQYISFSVLIGIISVFAVLLHKGMGMSNIDNASSYGVNKKKI